MWFPPIASKYIDIESFLFYERDKRPNFWKTESTPWHTLAAGDREEVRKSFLADEPQSFLFSWQRSQHLLVVDFSGGFPQVGIYTLNWVVFQCLNPPTCCDLVDGGFTHQGTHPKEVEEHEAIWTKMRAKGNMMTVSCQSCSTEWRGGLFGGEVQILLEEKATNSIRYVRRGQSVRRSI